MSRGTWRRALVRPALALVLAGTLAPHATAQLRALERAVEARAQQLVLPAQPRGTLVVTPCGGCAPLTLLATERTEYRIGAERVSLETLRRFLVVRPDTPVVVLGDAHGRELRRLLASAP